MFLSDAAIRAGATEVYLVMAESLFDRQDMDPNLIFDDSYDSFKEGKKRKLEKIQGQPFSLEASDKVYNQIYRCNPNNVFFNLDPVPVFVNYLLRLGLDIKNNGENIVFVAPDRGAKQAVEELYKLSRLSNASLIFCNKYRKAPNDPSRIEAEIESKSENYKGIEGKIVIGLDDKGDTLGTLNKTLIEGLRSEGNPKQIHALLSHMIFSSRTAYELIKDNKLNVHGSNSHPNMIFKKGEPGIDQISVLDFTPYFTAALVNNLVQSIPLPAAKIQI